MKSRSVTVILYIVNINSVMCVDQQRRLIAFNFSKEPANYIWTLYLSDINSGTSEINVRLRVQH